MVSFGEPASRLRANRFTRVAASTARLHGGDSEGVTRPIARRTTVRWSVLAAMPYGDEHIVLLVALFFDELGIRLYV